MPKEKKPAKKRFLTIFLLGFLIGSSLTWLPIDEWNSAELKTNTFKEDLFVHHLPTTTPLIQRSGHVIAYNGQTRNPYWVYHRVSAEEKDSKLSRTGIEFKEDPAIPPSIRATKKDYAKSGLDRGHLMPAADCMSQTEMEESFYLTNITPQHPSLNRGVWKKLEEHVRTLAQQYQTVHIFNGPLYLSKQIENGKRMVSYEVLGKNHVAVPTHFFMLIFAKLPSNKLYTKAYILPNAPQDPKTPLKTYLTSVDEVESASGVLFTNVLEKI